jgi:hypothetical protein
MTTTRFGRTLPLLFAGALSSCSSGTPEPGTQPAPPPPMPTFDQIGRDAFNAAAIRQALPFFWSKDTDGDGTLDPDELAVVFGMRAVRGEWVEAGGFTRKFGDVYLERALTGTAAAPSANGIAPEEVHRRELVMKELGQGRPTLIETDLSGAPAEDRALADHVLKAAELIEQLYMTQKGSWHLRDKLPADHPPSQTLFFRNQGPWCQGPATQDDKECNALPSRPVQIVSVYPAGVQTGGSGFCDELGVKVGQKWNDHFTVIKEEGAGLNVVPYSQAYQPEMEAIAKELDLAAQAVTSESEAALKAYLAAAAKAFRDNDWEKADEAWVAMNATNSKWYLRIGPDEVYWEPCALRAGFHTSFGRIDKGSLEWQERLDPFKDEMEQALAKLAGAPYKARKVSFKLPDLPRSC